jgi:hypothetical protein
MLTKEDVALVHEFRGSEYYSALLKLIESNTATCIDRAVMASHKDSALSVAMANRIAGVRELLDEIDSICALHESYMAS